MGQDRHRSFVVPKYNGLHVCKLHSRILNKIVSKFSQREMVFQNHGFSIPCVWCQPFKRMNRDVILHKAWGKLIPSSEYPLLTSSSVNVVVMNEFDVFKSSRSCSCAWASDKLCKPTEVKGDQSINEMTENLVSSQCRCHAFADVFRLMLRYYIWWQYRFKPKVISKEKKIRKMLHKGKEEEIQTRAATIWISCVSHWSSKYEW